MRNALLISNDKPHLVENVITVDPENLPEFPGYSIILYEGAASPDWKWDGHIASPPSPVIDDYIAAAQSAMDAYARRWGYDDIRSTVSFVGDPCAKYNAEGIALRAWRSAVWVYTENVLAFIDPKNPPTIAEVLAGMPAAPPRPVVS